MLILCSVVNLKILIVNSKNRVGVLINDQLSGIVSKTDVVKALAELK